MACLSCSAVNTDTRHRLIQLISDGHEPSAAAVALDMDVSVITKAGVKLRKAIDTAMSVGNARLKSKILELALEGGNVQALERQLERREALTVDATATRAIGRIERIVIDNAICPSCGYEHVSQPKGNGAVA